MFPGPGALLTAILFALGVIWCKHVFGSLRKDIEDFKLTDETGHRVAIALIWGFTGLVVCFLLAFVWNILSRIVGGLRSL